MSGLVCGAGEHLFRRPYTHEYFCGPVALEWAGIAVLAFAGAVLLWVFGSMLYYWIFD